MKLWPAVQGVAGTAIMAVGGWVLLQVVELKQQQSAEQAEDLLRDQITDVVNDIDKRMAVIETNQNWIRSALTGGTMGWAEAIEEEAMPLPAPEAAPAPPEDEDFPKYNLRQQSR